MAGDDGEARRRKATLGLWSIQGLGHAAIEAIADVYPDLSVLLDVPPRDWVGPVGLNQVQSEHLAHHPWTVRQWANHALHRANRAAMRICYLGDPAYPRGLGDIGRPPPMLFYWGRGDRPNAPRRLAMVGSRDFEVDYVSPIARFAFELARHVVVVSGGARGVDTLCHEEAVRAGGETWAFMGAGLDELDAVQVDLAKRIVGSGGTVFSNFPPGARPQPSNFPIRNRFIAGASDAVLVLRAAQGSGAGHTARDAQKQGKRIYAMPGQVDHETSVGINMLLRSRAARIATCPEDVLEGLGLLTAETPKAEHTAPAVDLSALSTHAQTVYAALTRVAVDFDTLLPRAAPLDSGQLASALVELELSGLLVRQPGRRFERA